MPDNANDVQAILADYRYVLSMQVRFADLDVLGHLNNAKYVTYMEQVRVQYFIDVCAWHGKWEEFGMILARTEIDYALPIFYGDTVNAYVRTSRLGGKSFDFHYVITRQLSPEAEPLIAAQAKTVMVAYDYGADTTIAIPEVWRQKITTYEPALSE
jgi:acyl-CoA thioester hydrolase